MLDFVSMNLSILVVLYDCDLAQSKTLQTLRSLLSDKPGCRVVVWNNGPCSLSGTNLDGEFPVGVDFRVYETVDNRSLAQIYNYFISTCVAEKYLFLDHDTELNRSFIDRVYELPGEFLGLPEVFSGETREYPRLNWSKGRAINEICDADVLMSCLSGMVLGREFVGAFLKSYETVFDESFVLYGVDTSFFLRVHKLRFNKAIKVLDPIEHSFSRNEEESSSMSRFRMLERSFDLGLTLRYYPNRHHFKILYYILLAFCKGRSVLSPYLVLKAYFSGRHYRSVQGDELSPVKLN